MLSFFNVWSSLQKQDPFWCFSGPQQYTEKHLKRTDLAVRKNRDKGDTNLPTICPATEISAMN